MPQVDQQREQALSITGRIAWQAPGFVYVGCEDLADWLTEKFGEGAKVKITVETE